MTVSEYELQNAQLLLPYIIYPNSSSAKYTRCNNTSSPSLEPSRMGSRRDSRDNQDVREAIESQMNHRDSNSQLNDDTTELPQAKRCRTLVSNKTPDTRVATERRLSADHTLLFAGELPKLIVLDLDKTVSL